jgi:hypothetical protein
LTAGDALRAKSLLDIHRGRQWKRMLEKGHVNQEGARTASWEHCSEFAFKTLCRGARSARQAKETPPHTPAAEVDLNRLTKAGIQRHRDGPMINEVQRIRSVLADTSTRVQNSAAPQRGVWVGRNHHLKGLSVGGPTPSENAQSETPLTTNELMRQRVKRLSASLNSVRYSLTCSEQAPTSEQLATSMPSDKEQKVARQRRKHLPRLVKRGPPGGGKGTYPTQAMVLVKSCGAFAVAKAASIRREPISSEINTLKRLTDTVFKFKSNSTRQNKQTLSAQLCRSTRSFFFVFSAPSSLAGSR